MDFSSLMQQATANQEYTKKKYDEIKRNSKEEEARRKEREQLRRERAKRKIELSLAEERARKIKPPPLVQPSETNSVSSSKHATSTCKSHAGKSSKKEKPSSVSCGTTTAAHKTVPPLSVKGHAPKHKANSTPQPPPQPPKQPASKPLDFKQLMEIASKQGSGNRSKELVKQQLLKQQAKSLSATVKASVATPTSSKPVKPVGHAGTNKPHSAVPPKQVSTHKGVAGNKITSVSLTKQRPSSATAAAAATKKLPETTKVNCKANSKRPGVKLKTGSFYQSSAMGSDWSDMKKTIKRPQQQQLQQRQLNGFNISGSWINELGLNKLPTDLDSDYEEDDDMSDFVASDDEGIDEDCEDYSAAIRDIFGYDRSRFGNDDTEVMESSYTQQQFEEKRSARIGKAEDEEDMKRELEEMRRKKRKK